MALGEIRKHYRAEALEVAAELIRQYSEQGGGCNVAFARARAIRI